MRDNLKHVVASYRDFFARLDAIGYYKLRRQVEVKTAADFYYSTVLGYRLTHHFSFPHGSVSSFNIDDVQFNWFSYEFSTGQSSENATYRYLSLQWEL